MKRSITFVTFALFFVVASCAVITVNIYFPEKDVKEAYKTLEKELMNVDKKPETRPEDKPQSSLGFELIPSAYAQEPGLTEKISEVVKKMPEVVNAYREMGARIADTDRLRDSGAVGEGNKGMLMEREKALPPADRNIVEMENANRRTVVNGMVRAIIRINRVPENEENLKQVMPQAIDQFAAIRRDSAKKGWWIQSPDGNWIRK